MDTSPPRKQRKGRTPGRKLRALCARGDASTVACSSLSRTSTRVGRIRPRLGFGRDIAATLETLPGSRQAADRGVTLRCPRVPGLAGLGTRGRPVGSGDPVPRNSLQGGRDCGRSWGPARGATGVKTWGSQGAKAGRLIFRANSRISLGNGSNVTLPLQRSLGSGITPCFARALGGCPGGPRGTVDPTARGAVTPCASLVFYPLVKSLGAN